MPFSHHSHSGQFCSHGKNTLEEMVRSAVDKKFHVFALTEHMPREQDDLYPEEIQSLQTQDTLRELFDAYIEEAIRLRTAYASKIELFIGLEIDWIRASSLQWIDGVLRKHAFDLFIGSVHHVHTIPIDYDHEMYVEARRRSGGTDKRLFEDYFDLQLEMLQGLKPPIVGHFDLIRLKSDEPNVDCLRWDTIRQKVSRNLDCIVEYGGLLELSSAALRKGLKEPYPAKSICEMHLAKGGQFTISDDCHSIDQIGANYEQLLKFAADTGITNFRYLKRSTPLNASFGTITFLSQPHQLTEFSHGPLLNFAPQTKRRSGYRSSRRGAPQGVIISSSDWLADNPRVADRYAALAFAYGQLTSSRLIILEVLHSPRGGFAISHKLSSTVQLGMETFDLISLTT